MKNYPTYYLNKAAIQAVSKWLVLLFLAIQLNPIQSFFVTETDQLSTLIDSSWDSSEDSDSLEKESSEEDDLIEFDAVICSESIVANSKFQIYTLTNCRINNFRESTIDPPPEMV